MLPQYYDIIIRDNGLAEVEKIELDKYNYFASIFNYVYNTKNGDTYPLHKNLDAGIDMLIVDDNHLHELLRDLFDQGFCDDIHLNYVGNYNGYVEAF